MKKWDLYNQYLVQGEEGAKTVQKYVEQVDKAEKKVNDLKIKLDEVFSIEVTSGVDKSSEKAKLRADIEAAEKEVAAKIEERSKAHEIVSNQGHSIKRTDLVLDYLNHYRPAVVASEVAPLVQKLEDARSTYFNALFDLYDKQDEYHEVYRIANEIARTTPINGSYYSVSNPVDFINDIKTAVISRNDIWESEDRIDHTGKELPSGIKRIKGAK
ncbi:hypothetical protein BABA_17382 [Neobacillus bataviensis LMG 21833]|uniref:Uncharacterized protein n=1 Tax=Neobacillus bataviensis LMG 21833 TaxID=1117379 RepID=K6DDB7_9BACI|nr:hypothetical protein [Neobacillus bataviensis]EKN66038.1 hypothetical protein BABA_17382 [Neobacillus bataviensis LMG 21833]